MDDSVAVRVGCPRCGTRRIPLADVLLVAPDDGAVYYEFTCPTCTDRVSAPADREVQRTLARNGIRVVPSGLDDELAEVESNPGVQDDRTP